MFCLDFLPLFPVAHVYPPPCPAVKFKRILSHVGYAEVINPARNKPCQFIPPPLQLNMISTYVLRYAAIKPRRRNTVV